MLTWLVYAIAAVVMLAVSAAAILAGLALRFVAAFLRELSDSREGGDSQVVFTGSSGRGNCKYGGTIQ